MDKFEGFENQMHDLIKVVKTLVTKNEQGEQSSKC